MAVVNGVVTMMEHTDINFDFDYVGSVPDRLICCICMKVMKNPHLVVCCGQKYCASCIQKWIHTQPTPTCPHCRARGNGGERPFQHVIERGMKSDIESLQTKCYYNRRGCLWTGEKRNLKNHLLAKDGCKFALIQCPNFCKNGCRSATLCLRKNLVYHLEHCATSNRVSCKNCLLCLKLGDNCH